MEKFQISFADWGILALERSSWHQHTQKGHLHLDKSQGASKLEHGEMNRKESKKISTYATSTIEFKLILGTILSNL